MLAKKLLTKEFHNSMRSFEKDINPKYFKLLKYFISSLVKQQSTVIADLYNPEKVEISKKKFIEKISKMLETIEIKEKVETQAINFAKKFSEDWNNIIVSYDSTDIAKPKSKKLPKLSLIYDASTKKYYNWYIINWVAVNEFLIHFDFVEPNFDKENNIYKASYSKKNRENLVLKVLNNFWNGKTIHIFDRFYDDSKFINFLIKHTKKFIVRWKKNRNIFLNEKKISVNELNFGKYKINFNWNELFVYIVESQKDWKIILYSNIDTNINEITNLYLKRRTIEQIFKAIKKYWLEKFRLRNIKKLETILAILQFIYNLVRKIFIIINKKTNAFAICIKKIFDFFLIQFDFKNNFFSFSTFFSQKIYLSQIKNYKYLPKNTLFPIKMLL